MSSKFPKPGEMFEGIYKIERILGAGGFARIYKGIESGIGRDVALKLLRPPTRTDQSDTQRDKYLKTVTERFQREAVMLSKLKSPHTVTMFSYGQTQSGLLYMVLEFIDGQTLTELRRSQERIAPARIVKMLRQVLISLREAHAMGMLHRDLKPGNIMIFEHLGTPDQIKLLDFGIAKLIGDAATESTNEDLTSDGTLIGTPRYMAPEQIQGKPVGPPSDLYALGLVGYELCVGQRAIEGDSSIQIIGQQLTPESFSVPKSANIPDRLRAVINKMMEKDSSRRYQTATEILNDLEHPQLLEYMEAGDLPSIEMSLVELSGPTEIEVFDEEVKSYRNPLIAAILLASLLFTIAGIVLYVKKADPKAAVAKVEVVEKIVNIAITAKSEGNFVPAVITVNGVDKGWTPLKIEASEIENATIIASYTDPISKEKLISRQEVTIPRDVIFEFETHVAIGGDIAVEEKVEVAHPAVVKAVPKKRRKTTARKETQPDEELKVFENKVSKKKFEKVEPKEKKKRSLMETDVAKKDKKKVKQKKSLLDF